MLPRALSLVSVRAAAAVLSLVVGLGLAPVAAQAQNAEPTNKALDRWQPALDLEAPAGVDVATRALVGAHDLWLTLGYAHNLLVVADHEAGESGELLGPRLTSHLGGSLTLARWLQIGANLPLVLYQGRGASPPSAFGPVGDLASAGVGDLSLAAKLLPPFFQPAWVDLALLAGMSVPTHLPRDAYLGEKNVTFSTAAVASRSVSNFLLAANLGYHWRETSRFLDTKIGPEIRLGFGAGYDLEPLTELPLRAAVSWRIAARHDAPLQRINESPSELLFEATYLRWAPLAIRLAGGFGILAGVGTPDARVMLSVRWVGRPKDGDNDRIADAEDDCPEQREDYDGFEDHDGCPDLDNDQDEIGDDEDECPNEPENFNGFEDEDGCPDKAAELAIDRIQLAANIHFEVNRAILKQKSRMLLNEIADILAEHPQIKKVQIEGHTDSDGDEQANLQLSQNRADAVKAYLVSRGIQAERLSTQGYGETRPRASNDTPRGKALNRRVEFVIKETSD